MPRVILSDLQKAKKKRGLCVQKFCGKRALSGKNVCSMHNMRKYAANNPLRYKFNNLRIHARHRNIPFELNFEQFKKMAVETGYSVRSGVKKRNYQIDRIDATKGYTIDNIQVLTCSANSRKGATVDKAAYAEARRNGSCAVDAYSQSKACLQKNSEGYEMDLDCGF